MVDVSMNTLLNEAFATRHRRALPAEADGSVEPDAPAAHSVAVSDDLPPGVTSSSVAPNSRRTVT
jgi:hypothetical protein